MKELFGSPGKASGLLLRTGQFFFAGASVGAMASAAGFSISTAFCYLIASMGLQALWSLGLACLDIHALRLKRRLQTPILLSLLAVGDWVTSILSLGAASSSAGVMILFVVDSDLCKRDRKLECNMFGISIALAFISWFLLAISSYVMMWMLASVD
ncbi:hypothetical protein DCAR_0313255 [Daucus carota subsp. sativus]|uniref:CASP-like protein n=1 Tax=Daucus carota subsp. sativus TaxID=79200 RepID=A0AAF0WQ15_DAUCS|nr:PREDICTED: CASP-like protein 5B1 [Daucus carota subsp. sativus]WOG93965.1 hypothetical protein DCAR_0313255 [Daucus carota subsp. sativus]